MASSSSQSDMAFTKEQGDEMIRRTEAARGRAKIKIDPMREDNTPLPAPVQEAVNAFHKKRTVVVDPENCAATAASMLAIATPGKRLRQDTKPVMNKLETEWFNRLSQNGHITNLRAQSKRFKLANGIWYKPDFTGIFIHKQEFAWEVKGPKSWRGGFENLKMAAAQYPEIKWILAWKENGSWKTQEVLP